MFPTTYERALQYAVVFCEKGTLAGDIIEFAEQIREYLSRGDEEARQAQAETMDFPDIYAHMGDTVN